jgi:hypothetical protein
MLMERKSLARPAYFLAANRHRSTKLHVVCVNLNVQCVVLWLEALE